MPLDKHRVKLTKSWFQKSLEDIETAQWMFKREPPIIPTVLYHFQQAIEKSLKGFLIWHDVPFSKTHVLGEISDLCFQVSPSLRPDLEQIIPISKYAWKFRYPGNYRLPPFQEVVKALDLTSMVYEKMPSLLPPEVRPDKLT